MKLGYTLSSEEHRPLDLLDFAPRAEEAGFAFLSISDHFHPWISKQGNSPFVWSVLGGLSRATERILIGTGVTCPTIRIHPAIVAHAAATAASMLPGRFYLGVGTGENLNEHVLGDRWPAADLRLEMLEEAVEVIRSLWSGEETTHRGSHYTVERARIYTLPEELPPIHVAASGPRATELAARIGDGLIGTSPDLDAIRTFEKAGGEGKPRFGQVHVCWAEDPEEAKRTAYEWWPNTALPGNLFVELESPKHFEAVTELISQDDVAGSIPTGPDPEPYIEAIREYAEAGYDHVYLHQIGPDQQRFLEFAEREILPALS